MARVDYYRDPSDPRFPDIPDIPDIPTANRIVVAVTAFVLDSSDRVLLIRRTDNELWALPGGAQEIGESVADTVVRETLEESGICVEVLNIVGVYSNPNHVVAFDDGEVRQQFSICFRCRPVGGRPTTSDESSDVRWVSEDGTADLAIHPSMRLRISHGYANLPQPHIG